MSAAECASDGAATDELRSAFLECLIAPDARRAGVVIADGLAGGTSAASLYLDVIDPAMRDVGLLWERAKIGLAQEHLATQITQSVIATLGLQLRADASVGTGRVALVASTPGERHALGGQIVADFLESQGWSTLALGPNTPLTDLLTFARDQQADLVALSTALPRNLLSVTRACGLLRRLDPAPLIVVGGQAYNGNPEQALAVGADAFAEGPASLLDLLAVRFALDAAH